MFDRRQFLGSGAAMLGAGALAGSTFARHAFAADAPLDVALVGGNVWTGTAGGRADAIGMIGDRIVAVGARAVKARMKRSTRVVDLKGAFAMPAFTDNHTHFLMGSAALPRPDLLEVKSREEFVARIGAAVKAQPDRWLLGGPWDEQRFGGQLPTREWVDAVTGDTPIALPRTDLHSYFCNSVALKLAGITRDTPDPAGGVIVRDEKGEPTGVVKDLAKALIDRVIPPLTHAQQEDAVRGGIAHGLKNGFAQVHVPDPFDWDCFDTVRRLRAKGETDMRFYNFVPLADWEKVVALVKEEGRGDDWVRWGACKALVDGSLGARTALFHDPYTDDPHTRGVRVMPLAELREKVIAADAAGVHITVHAIGDEANDDILDVYAEAVKLNGTRDRRFRVEHAQHILPATIPRFAKQKVIASVQPYHAIDDGRWAVKRIGEKRLDGTYAFASLMNSGATVTFGSDWPVAPLSAVEGIYAAVMRETIDGANPHGWLPDQKVTVEQSLTAYTVNNAFAGFMEDRSGRIAPGMLADVVVLDRDPTAIDPETLPKTEVLRTFVGGRERYTASAA
ncbi:amidohydrolase [Novosphingobium resinovorum]|uniref:amidohydrolase n=1 Tax=Novosphingobium resinovorum TaxID=158500 RepID=UPI002ED1B6F9|nr:amidohydrolase [Novosphingobium resinovorum]